MEQPWAEQSENHYSTVDDSGQVHPNTYIAEQNQEHGGPSSSGSGFATNESGAVCLVTHQVTSIEEPMASVPVKITRVTRQRTV